MKQFIMIVVILLTGAIAMADEVKYEVTIEVVYNALDKRDVSRVVEDAMIEHEKACKVVVTSKKVEESNETDVIIDTYSIIDADTANTLQ